MSRHRFRPTPAPALVPVCPEPGDTCAHCGAELGQVDTVYTIDGHVCGPDGYRAPVYCGSLCEETHRNQADEDQAANLGVER